MAKRRVAARSCSDTNPSTACRSPSTEWLLSDKLRGDWHYQGTLITDWDNVGRFRGEQKVKADYVHAAADAVKAGNDLMMTTPKFYEGAIEAVKTGLLDESLIDEAVSRILALKFRLGLFEDPRLPDQERIKTVIGSKAHQELQPANRTRIRGVAEE